jgi:hypothetical protein
MKTKDLGFVLIKLNNNTIYDNILDAGQQIIDNNSYANVCIFNSFCDKIDTKNIPILHLAHAKFFYGDLMCFDTMSLLLTQNFPNIKHRYFYAQNIPWFDDTSVFFTQWQKLFQSPNIEIIAKNSEIYNIYNICWKKPVGISENFKYEELNEFI